MLSSRTFCLIVFFLYTLSLFLELCLSLVVSGFKLVFFSKFKSLTISSQEDTNWQKRMYSYDVNFCSQLHQKHKYLAWFRIIKRRISAVHRCFLNELILFFFHFLHVFLMRILCTRCFIKGPLFLSFKFTEMMINLHEIFTTFSWRNTNSKYFNKIWQLIKYTLLGMM